MFVLVRKCSLGSGARDVWVALGLGDPSFSEGSFSDDTSLQRSPDAFSVSRYLISHGPAHVVVVTTPELGDVVKAAFLALIPASPAALSLAFRLLPEAAPDAPYVTAPVDVEPADTSPALQPPEAVASATATPSPAPPAGSGHGDASALVSFKRTVSAAAAVHLAVRCNQLRLALPSPCALGACACTYFLTSGGCMCVARTSSPSAVRCVCVARTSSQRRPVTLRVPLPSRVWVSQRPCHCCCRAWWRWLAARVDPRTLESWCLR